MLPIVRAALQVVDTFADSARGAGRLRPHRRALTGDQSHERDRTAQAAPALAQAETAVAAAGGAAGAAGAVVGVERLAADGSDGSAARPQLTAVARYRGAAQPHGAVERPQKRLAERLAARRRVQAALAAGDWRRPASSLGAGLAGRWRKRRDPAADLSAAYAELPKSGYGRIAVAEAALAGNKTDGLGGARGRRRAPGAGRAGTPRRDAGRRWRTCACR